MKNKKVIFPQAALGIRCLVKGFTLIELLVVVLIMGILAAVALPQYQKAVRKARIAEAKVLLKATADATDVFILANPGKDPKYEGNLDIDVPAETNNWNIYIDECADGSNGRFGCIITAEPLWESGYDISYASTNYNGGPENDPTAGRFICNENGDHSICKGLSSQQIEREDEEEIEDKIYEL